MGAAAGEGKIKKIVRDKGYGFIKDAQGREWFFHKQDMQDRDSFDSMNEGDAVSFTEDSRNPKGPRALDVRVEN